MALVPNLVNSGVVKLRLDKDSVKTFQTIDKETLKQLSTATSNTTVGTATTTNVSATVTNTGSSY